MEKDVSQQVDLNDSTQICPGTASRLSELEAQVEALSTELSKWKSAFGQPLKFPVMLRKMHSGGDVQKWIDENWPLIR